MLLLKDSLTSAIAQIWLKPDNVAALDVPGRLRGALQQKILQRLNLRITKFGERASACARSTASKR